jgi:CheY-like chemotaxis protein
MTGWGQEADRQNSKEVGFDHHLVKPVDPHTLMMLLAGLNIEETSPAYAAEPADKDEALTQVNRDQKDQH